MTKKRENAQFKTIERHKDTIAKKRKRQNENLKSKETIARKLRRQNIEVKTN